MKRLALVLSVATALLIGPTPTSAQLTNGPLPNANQTLNVNQPATANASAQPKQREYVRPTLKPLLLVPLALLLYFLYERLSAKDKP